ncbi:MAG: nucleotidyltransferase domain-containing protein [Mariprofundaceae bacterium]|nr:nucleotidyltransferase domain-containing protein [Mariprofundaceae bacterium]
MAIVRRILGALMPEHEVRAFGSRVHGRCLKKFSDIDLAIIADTPIDSGRLSELKEAFSESDLPYRVDVVDYASASPAFRDIIAQEYEVLQKPGKTHCS